MRRTRVSELIERKLDPGKFRIPLPHGVDVEAVSLKGMRKRSWPLMHISVDELKKRMPTDLDGTMVSVEALCSVPVAYARQGPWVLVWPAPRHEWTVEIDITKREKVFEPQTA